MTLHKIKMKVGPHEFEAEGDKDSVQEQLRLWSDLIKAASPQEPIVQPTINQTKETSVQENQIDNLDQNLNKLFIVDEKNHALTLKYLPFSKEKEAEAFLILLFGYKKILDKDELLVTELKRSLEKSGVAVARVDRLASRFVADRMVLKRGSGKGSRYAISNTGMARSLEIAQDLRGVIAD